MRPQQWQAVQACQPAFARVVDPGRVHKTQDGLYIEAMEIGEMGEDGAEARFRYGCYVDSQGQFVKGRRADVP